MTQGSNKSEQLKGYKVTNVDRTRRFGVACRNLQELKRKACAKLNIPNEEQQGVAVFLVDGSLVDEEYFLTVQPQTTLILQRPGEKVLSDADILYNTLRQVNLEFLTTGDAVTRFLSQNLKSKVAVLNKALNKDDSKTLLSSRDDHPEWFKNLETTMNTKEAYMHRRCQDRIRSYLYKTIDQIRSSDIYSKNEIARRHLTHVISYFKLQLREDHCLGFYFDRSYARDREREDSVSIVDSEGKKAVKTDDVDSVSNCPYGHCPCKIGLGTKSYGGDKLLDEFFASEDNIAGDELDARKIQSNAAATGKKIKEKEDAGEDYYYSPYEIRVNCNQSGLALCDNKGEFHCDGVWNAERCAYADRHCINPYRSYEELVLFSTWNLDHRIERSRTLIPNLLKASEQDTISQKDVRYFYDNIFTIKNLRLVHIICHDKGAHNHKQQV